MLGLKEEQLRGIYEFAPLPIHILDEQKNIKWVNREWLTLLGFGNSDLDKVVGKNFMDFLTDDTRPQVETSFKLLMKDRVLKYDDIKLKTTTGNVLDISASSRIIFDKGTFLYSYSILFDMSGRSFIQQDTTDANLTDYLTGLYNRRAIINIIETEISRMDRHGGELSLLMVDINELDAINNTFGQSVGDSVIISASRFIGKHKRASDSVSRYGGDEFLVVLPETEIDGAMVYADRLAYDLKIPLNDGKEVSLSLSIGVAEFSEDIMDAESFIKNAKAALSNVKAGKSGRISIYGE